MSIVIYFSISSQGLEFKKRMVAYGDGLKYLAYAGIRHPMATGDSASVERQLLNIKKTVEGFDIAICNVNEQIIFSTDEKILNKKVSGFILNKEARDTVKNLLETGERLYEKSFDEVTDDKKYLINLYGILNEKECYSCHDASKKVIGALIIKQSADETFAAMASLRNRTVVIGILGIVAIITMLYFLLERLVTRPAVEFSRKAEEIAAGDLTVKIEVKGNDEIASLGRAINKIAANLKDMLTKVRAVANGVLSVTDNIALSSNKVLSGANMQRDTIEKTGGFIEGIDNSISSVAMGAESLSDSAEKASSAVFEMTTAIERIAESTSIFSLSASDAASSIEEMIASIKEIADSLEMLSASSEETASSLNEINTAVKEVENSAVESVALAERVTTEASDKGMSAANAAIKGMEDIKNSVGALAEVINRLGKRSEEIGLILNVIAEVADQTNLLSLNAAILAAQAGEHGRSFAVVADEIKGLAGKTSLSTKEIAKLVESVQTETRSSVEMAERGIQSVEKGTKLVREVNLALKSILDSSHTSTEKAKLIQNATTEEAYVIKGITEAITNMNEQTELISKATKEQNKGSIQIMEAIEKIKELAQHVKTATGEQSKGSKEISETIGNVFSQAEQIEGATAQQREKSKEIVKTIESIKKVAADSVNIANEMNSSVKTIGEEARVLLAELRKFKV